MLQISMSKLSLKVLLGLVALMFSANESHSFPIECTNVDPTPLFSTFSSPSAAKSWLPNKVVLKESSIKYFNTHKKRSSKENSWTVFFRSTKVVAKYMPVNKKLRVQLVFQAAYKQVAPVYYTKCVDKSRSVKNTTSASNTSKASNQNKLKSTFMKKTSTDRRNIQSALSELGLYTSTIDGLYGKGTAAALKAYNKEYLANADLSKKTNVNALMRDILTLQVFEVEQASANKPSKTFASWSDDTICKYVNEKGKDIHVAEAKERGLSCGVEEKQPMPEPEPTPKLDIAQVKVSYDAKDYTKAFADAQVLAVQGDPEAQLLLGKMFADGRGTLQVSTVAHMWFNIASVGGIDEAYEQRKAIIAQMTPSAVEEAQKMAMRCIQSNYADCGLAIKPAAVKQPKPVAKTYITSGSQVEAWFKNETQLKRKQLHYALKKLGLYPSSVDGLWGANTSRAFTRYINNYKSDAETVNELFLSVLSQVKVPTKFAEPKRTTKNKTSNRSDNAGLTAIVSNPSMSGKQALAVCGPQAQLAGSRASSSYQAPNYGSSTYCTGFGYSVNCNTRSNSGGVWGGLAEGLAAGFTGRAAREATMKSCLAQYGWKK